MQTDTFHAHRLGLTGGIGSGKSTAAGMLARLGAVVIDADAISRAITASGGIAIHPIQSAFGDGVLTANRALDREKMRRLIFSEPAAKARLEAIVHPLVGQAIAQQEQQAQAAKVRCMVFDIPLLVESGRWRQMLDRILVIDCEEETQIARVTARSGMAAADVQKIMATQASRPRRLAAADLIVFNDGISIEDLAQRMQEIGTEFGL
ncbi:MAG: dephospho-CoA kinase [Rhodoferax sp.]|nr:dephospho-CoA kinase [Rhodoferax sp.]